jgi:hypothetical protein
MNWSVEVSIQSERAQVPQGMRDADPLHFLAVRFLIYLRTTRMGQGAFFAILAASLPNNKFFPAGISMRRHHQKIGSNLSCHVYNLIMKVKSGSEKRIDLSVVGQGAGCFLSSPFACRFFSFLHSSCENPPIAVSASRSHGSSRP